MIKQFRRAKALKSEFVLPGDMGIGIYALVLASLANGDTDIRHFPEAYHCARMIAILETFGVSIEQFKDENRVVIHGRGKKAWTRPEKGIDIGESEILLWLLSGAIAGQGIESQLYGNLGFSQYPLERLINPLKNMNAQFSAHENRFLPLKFSTGALAGCAHTLAAGDFYTKAALLVAGLNANGTTTVVEPGPADDIMERMLMAFGAQITMEHNGAAVSGSTGKRGAGKKNLHVRPYSVSINGQSELTGRKFVLPVDNTCVMAFAVLATIIQGSNIKIKRVLLNPNGLYGLRTLEQLGAKIKMEIEWEKNGMLYGSVEVKSARLAGCTFESGYLVKSFDYFPFIAFAAAFAEGKTVIRNFNELRKLNEINVNSTVENLEIMGVSVKERPGSLAIKGRNKYAGEITFRPIGDSRLVAALLTAGLCFNGTSTVGPLQYFGNTFPEFMPMLDQLMGITYKYTCRACQPVNFNLHPGKG